GNSLVRRCHNRSRDHLGCYIYTLTSYAGNRSISSRLWRGRRGGDDPRAKETEAPASVKRRRSRDRRKNGNPNHPSHRDAHNQTLLSVQELQRAPVPATVHAACNGEMLLIPTLRNLFG